MVFGLVVAGLVLTGAMRSPAGNSAAGDQDVETRLNNLEMRIEQIAEQRRRVKDDINRANRFAVTTADWIAKVNQVEAEIREVTRQKQSGSYNIYDNRQLDEHLQTLRTRLEHIKQLEGGQEIDGASYTSVYQLQDEMKVKRNEVIGLNGTYLQLSQQLHTLDRELDQLVPQAMEIQKRRLKGDQARLSYLREDLEHAQTGVDNEGIWLYETSWSPILGVPHVSREMAILKITQDYIEELMATPGKKVDSTELAERIRSFQAESNRLKSGLRNQTIPEIRKQISVLEQRIQKGDAGSSDIRGCWVIMVGRDNFPVIDISSDPSGNYVAVITNVGRLDHFRAGNRLFSVTRISATTYSGTEYSFDVAGIPVQVGLRLVMGDDDDTIHYRSDEVLTLRRCR